MVMNKNLNLNEQSAQIATLDEKTCVEDSLISRCKRRNRTWDELGLKTIGGIPDLIDNAIKQVFRITDQEYDYLAKNLNDVEMSYFVNETLSFREKKECLKILEKHLKKHYESLKSL
ncbi:MAG: hypothetical protein SFU91_06665 [Chloroherpetonaceae bacterium]|nr:hypothetical protein [Chloroherpetonaceae bacterium]